jgi:hypothetical protein
MDADTPRDLRHSPFERSGAVVVQDRDAEALEASRPQLGELSSEALEIRRELGRPVAERARVELQYRFGKRLGSLDGEREQVGPCLVADAQQIPEAARDGERRAHPASLEERVGRDGGAEPHVAGRQRIGRIEPDQAADALDRGAVRGQHLRDAELAARAIARDAVGEGAASIDPDVEAEIAQLSSLGPEVVVAFGGRPWTSKRSSLPSWSTVT